MFADDHSQHRVSQVFQLLVIGRSLGTGSFGHGGTVSERPNQQFRLAEAIADCPLEFLQPIFTHRAPELLGRLQAVLRLLLGLIETGLALRLEGTRGRALCK